MKKRIVLLSLSTIFASVFTFAQNTFPNGSGSGNVGIGTSSPGEQLHINGTMKIEGTAGNGGARIFRTGSNSITSHLYLANVDNATAKAYNFQLNGDGSAMNLWTYSSYVWANKFTFSASGSLGIGTTNPSAYLHVASGNNSGTGLYVEQNYTSPYAIGLRVKTWNDYSTAFQVQLNGASTSHVFNVQGNGKTIIGGTIPSNHTDAYLAVAGKIVCRDLYVTTSNWADYVFEKDYKLPNLLDVKNFYLVNKHLPGVPTACEIEETGINVAEITTIQMQKIEELTIYMVQMKEEIEQLKKENELLKLKLNK